MTSKERYCPIPTWKLGIERAKLHQVFLAAAAAVPSRLGLSVSALTHRDAGVAVDFSDGSTGLYDLVVGADGIASSIRALTLSVAAPVAWC